MSETTELIAQQILNGNINKRTWGDIIYNVKVYGAIGNGIKDDTAKIADAIEDAAISGGIVYFPPGTYIVGSTMLIPSNITLQGSGSDLSIIKIKAQPTISGPNYGGSQKIITNNTTVSPYNKNISLLDLGFDGNGANQTYLINISFNGVSNLKIQRCKFVNFGKTGLYNQGLVVFGGSRVSITENYFGFCSGDGLAIAEGTDQAIVSNNYMVSNMDYGVAITNNCINVTVTGNVVLNNGESGIGVDECAGVVVTGNVCKNNKWGIQFLRFSPNLSYPNDFYVCTGNVIRGNTIGIGIGDSTKVVVSGNQISESSDKGIQLIESTDCTITGNDITTCTNEGLLFISYVAVKNCGDCLVSGNRIEGCAYGIRELSAGGPIIESSLFGNRLENNTNPSVLVSSMYFHLFNKSPSGIKIETNALMNYDTNLKATAATAGAATALPATPDGYLIINVGGVGKKIPYFSF